MVHTGEARNYSMEDLILGILGTVLVQKPAQVQYFLLRCTLHVFD